METHHEIILTGELEYGTVHEGGGGGLWIINPLSLHDALKHLFASLKTHLIFLQPRVLERNFHEIILPIHGNFL